MIEIKNLTKTYKSKSSQEIKALVNVSFTLPNNGLYFITGQSGSGKSTLLNLIGGLDKPDNGEIIVNNESLSSYSNHDYDDYRNSTIGFIFQEYNLLETLTVKDNLLLTTNMQNKQVSDEEIIDLLKKVELEDIINRYPNELSGGQRQRVSIARALIKNSTIILADEPTGSVDYETGIQIFELLKRLSKDTLIIVVSHDREFASTYADGTLDLKDGKILSNTIKPLKDEKIVNSQIKIKSNIPFKLAKKFAKNDFKKKPISLTIIILMMSISFLLFGISMSINMYNFEDAVTNSMSTSGTNYASLESELIAKGNHEFGPQLVNISDEKIDTLKSNYPNQSFYPIVDSFKIDLAPILFEPQKSFSYTSFTGGVELTPELINDFNLKLVAGTTPKVSTGIPEAVISKRSYEHFQKYGLKINDEKVYINHFDDLIGQIIKIHSRDKFKIVGIIDTNFDDSKFHDLYNNTIENAENEILKNEWKTFHSTSIHNLVFLTNGYAASTFYSPSNDYTYSSYETNFVEFNLLFDEKRFEGSYAPVKFISANSKTFKKIHLKEGTTIDRLKDNQILIPYFYLFDHYKNSQPFDFKTELQNRTSKAIENFAIENFQQIKEQFDNHFLYDSNYHNYINYILNTNDFSPNIFHQNASYLDFEWRQLEILFNDHYFDILKNLVLSGGQNTYRIDYNVEVVGVYYRASFRDGDTNGSIIISNNFFDKLTNDFYIYNYSRILVSMGINKNDNKVFIRDMIRDGDNPKFLINNGVITTLSYIDSILVKIAKYSLYIGLFFVISAVLLIFIFVSLMIKDNKKDIGILKALGASNQNIMRTYLIDSIIIALISSVIASILGIILNIVVKNTVSGVFSSIFLVNFGLLQILIILFIALTVSVISSIYPIYKITLRSPIEIISDK